MLFNITILNPDNLPLTHSGAQVHKLEMMYRPKDDIEAADLVDHFLSELDSSDPEVSEWISQLYQGGVSAEDRWSYYENIKITWFTVHA